MKFLQRLSTMNQLKEVNNTDTSDLVKKTQL